MSCISDMLPLKLFHRFCKQLSRSNYTHSLTGKLKHRLYKLLLILQSVNNLLITTYPGIFHRRAKTLSLQVLSGCTCFVKKRMKIPVQCIFQSGIPLTLILQTLLRNHVKISCTNFIYSVYRIYEVHFSTSKSPLIRGIQGDLFVRHGIQNCYRINFEIQLAAKELFSLFFHESLA